MLKHAVACICAVVTLCAAASAVMFVRLLYSQYASLYWVWVVMR